MEEHTARDRRLRRVGRLGGPSDAQGVRQGQVARAGEGEGQRRVAQKGEEVRALPRLQKGLVFGIAVRE